jgi:hypothetical protein
VNETAISRPVAYDANRGAPPREISLIDLLNAALRFRATIVVCALFGGIVGVLPVLFQQPTYTATASFIVSGSDVGKSGLVSLAGQLGVSVPPGGAQSSQFYADLLKTGEVLRPIAEDTFRLARAGNAIPFVDLFNIPGDTPPLRRDLAVRELAMRLVDVRVSKSSDVVSVSANSRWPEISLMLVERLLRGLDSFTVRMRHTQAAADRQYSEERLAEAHAALEHAEDRLGAWLEANRVWQTSPELVLEHDRLQRDVSLQQQIFAAAAESLEDAHAREMRSTPLVTVVDTPTIPTSPNPRGRVRRAVVGMLFGGVLGLLIALGRYVVGLRGTSDPGLSTLRALAEDVRLDFMPWRRRGRRASAGQHT